MGTLERAFEESRTFANACSGHGVRATGRVDPFDDPIDLTFQAPVARHAESARPPMLSTSSSVRCFNCGQTGHMRSNCSSLRRSPSPMHYSGGFGQRTSRSPRSNADAFRPGGMSRRCFVCGSPNHLAQACPSRSSGFAGNGRPPTGRVQTMMEQPEVSHGGVYTMRESSGRLPLVAMTHTEVAPPFHSYSWTLPSRKILAAQPS